MTDEERENILNVLESDLARTRTYLPPNWNSRENFNRCLLLLDKQSSPGWPLCKEAPTIGQWLFKGGLFPDPIRSEMLWNMIQDFKKGTYEHFYKVFIKNEPHKVSKVQSEKWRLIMISSLPVQVYWHMAVNHLERSFLQTTGQTPLFHGFVYFGGGWRKFNHIRCVKRLDWCADKSGWDWSSPGWVYEACKELRKRLTNGATKEWEDAIDLLYEDAYVSSKILLPDGRVVQQQIPGLMKSGLVVTISDNGIAQLLLHRRAELRLGMLPSNFIATGDDTFQETPPDIKAYVSELQRGGCILKDYANGTDFMGFEFHQDGFTPKYVAKHIMNFIMQKDEFAKETLESYCLIYAYNKPMREFWRDVAAELNYCMPSVSYYEHFCGNPNALEGYSVARPKFLDRE